MNKRKWSEAEDTYIIQNFGKKTFSELAKTFNCAISTVQNRAIELGLDYKRKTAKRWTEEEIELLKIMAPKYLNKTIAQKLDRSITEVNKKARELEIQLIFKRPIWKKWKIKYLKENINKMTLTQLQKELDVNYNQIIDKITELGLIYNNDAWSDEEVNILIELSKKVYIREIAKVLNRTEGAIISKAKKLNLEYITLKKEYKEEELQYIKENWGIIPVNEMARILGLTSTMIHKQAMLMNLQKLGNNPYRKWRETEIKQLETMASKKTITELARFFKTTNHAITTVAHKYGIILKDEKIHWTEEDNAKLRLLSEKYDLSELSIAMNRTPGAIRSQALRLNIKIIPNKKHNTGTWVEEDTNKLIKLVKDGKTLVEICDLMQKSEPNIIRHAKMLGLVLKDEEKFWSDAEITELKELAKTKKLSEIAQELNRSSSSILEKAEQLNIVIIRDKKYWTEEEYKILEHLTMVEKKTPKEIATMLNRSEDAIIIKISRRGLKVQTNDKRFWTTEEETLLADLWGLEPFENIAKKLNRTVSSIKNKAHLLGLGSAIENNYNGLTIKDISELFGVNITTVSVAWISLGLKHKIQRISKTKSYRYVEIKDLYEFLEENQNIWDSRNLEKNILGLEPDWLKEKRKLDVEKNLDMPRLNLTKQQLILARKFFLELQENEIENQMSLKRTRIQTIGGENIEK